MSAVKVYIRLAGELLSMAGYMGLAGIGKRKNAVLRGAILGGLAGTGVAFLQDNTEDGEITDEKEIWRKRIVIIVLYIIGGLMAGKAVKYFNKEK